METLRIVEICTRGLEADGKVPELGGPCSRFAINLPASTFECDLETRDGRRSFAGFLRGHRKIMFANRFDTFYLSGSSNPGTVTAHYSNEGRFTPEMWATAIAEEEWLAKLETWVETG